jgi:hypothetical protein
MPKKPEETVAEKLPTQTSQAEDSKKAKKRAKIFFNTIEGLQQKKERYEAKLKTLVGPQFRRKRANTLKVIMQINRALSHPDTSVKNPEEIALQRKKDAIRRVAKKLEKKRLKEVRRNVRFYDQQERYGGEGQPPSYSPRPFAEQRGGPSPGSGRNSYRGSASSNSTFRPRTPSHATTNHANNLSQEN